ncbi:MAG: YncE family protein [Rhodothermales bacterium]|nr:YncE family protein [Rhodothermales bacterium]
MTTIVRSFLALMLLVLVGGCASSSNQIANAQTTELLYVCNQGAATVSVIDSRTLEIVKTIDLQEMGYTANAKPHHIAVLEDGTWFLSLIGDNKILKFNRDDEVVAEIEYEVPGMLILNPEKDQILVGRSMSAVNPPRRIGFIDPTAATVEEVETFYPRPHALNIHPSGNTAYSASLAQNSLGAFSTEDGEMELYNSDGKPLVFVQFVVSPDGKTLVGTSQGRSQLIFFDVTDEDNPVMTDSIMVKGAPWHPLFSADGKYIYFGNKMGNAVTVVDAVSKTIVKEIQGEGISEPHGSSLSPDGKRLFISNNNLKGGYTPQAGGDATKVGTVVVIDTESLEIEKVIEVGANTTGLSPIVKLP